MKDIIGKGVLPTINDKASGYHTCEEPRQKYSASIASVIQTFRASCGLTRSYFLC